MAYRRGGGLAGWRNSWRRKPKPDFAVVGDYDARREREEREAAAAAAAAAARIVRQLGHTAEPDEATPSNERHSSSQQGCAIAGATAVADERPSRAAAFACAKAARDRPVAAQSLARRGAGHEQAATELTTTTTPATTVPAQGGTGMDETADEAVMQRCSSRADFEDA